MSLYDSDGNIKYTVVLPSDVSPFGIYAYDGSLRVVNAALDNGFGMYAKNGAYRISFSDTDRMFDKSGALSLFYLTSGKFNPPTGYDYLIGANGEFLIGADTFRLYGRTA